MEQYAIYIRLVLFVAIMAFFISSTKKIADGVGRALLSMFSLNKILETDRELILKVNREYALTFLAVLSSFLISYHIEYKGDAVSIEQIYLFFQILIGLTLYFLVRRGVLALLDYVNDTNCFKTIHQIFKNYLIIALFGIISVGLICMFTHQIGNRTLIICILSCCSVSFAIYLYMATSIFFKNKFSLFFYILYICALEILPIAMAVKLIQVI